MKNIKQAVEMIEKSQQGVELKIMGTVAKNPRCGVIFEGKWNTPFKVQVPDLDLAEYAPPKKIAKFMWRKILPHIDSYGDLSLEI